MSRDDGPNYEMHGGGGGPSITKGELVKMGVKKLRLFVKEKVNDWDAEDAEDWDRANA